jgi:hypothetical protein
MEDTTAGFEVEIVEALAPQTSPLNPIEVPAWHVSTYFRLSLRGHFYHPLSGRHGGYYWGKIPQYRGSLITTRGYGYDRLPPAANDWGAIHPIPYKGPTTLG